MKKSKCELVRNGTIKQKCQAVKYFDYFDNKSYACIGFNVNADTHPTCKDCEYFVMNDSVYIDYIFDKMK